MASIQDMTPVEIDTELSKLWNQEAEAEARLQTLMVSLHKVVGDEPRRMRGVGGPIFKLSPEKTLELAIIKAYGHHVGSRAREEAEEMVRLLTSWALVCQKLDILASEIKVYTDEYTCRGGWNRVFLAQSHDGHAHNDTECSTCHHGENRTQFAWLTQYSGKSQDEIVADAGERACTTCYPSAPVNAKGTKMFTPDEIEAQRRREEQDAERARKAKEAADKSIKTPEGKTLYLDHDHRAYEIAKSVRAAEITATNALVQVLLERGRENDPDWAWRTNGAEVLGRKYAYQAWYLIRAIAAKKGLTFQEVFETHEKKAQVKLRKLDREWAKDPRNPNRSK